MYYTVHLCVDAQEIEQFSDIPALQIQEDERRQVRDYIICAIFSINYTCNFSFTICIYMYVLCDACTLQQLAEEKRRLLVLKEEARAS